MNHALIFKREFCASNATSAFQLARKNRCFSRKPKLHPPTTKTLKDRAANSLTLDAPVDLSKQA